MNIFLLFAAKYLILFLFLPLIYFWLIGERKLVIRVLVSVILAEIFSLLIGAFFPTPRPFVIFGITPPPIFFFGVSTSSFPSSHTAVGAALAMSVLLEKKLLGRFLLLLALAIGVARVLSLVHFWWDILGGAFLGILCALLFGRLLRRLNLFPSGEVKRMKRFLRGS